METFNSFVEKFITNNTDNADVIVEAWKEDAMQEAIKMKIANLLPKPKKPKDPKAPKGAKSAYLFFCEENREKAKEELEEEDEKYSSSDVMVKLGTMWNELDQLDKVPYNRKAEQDKKRHEKEMDKYTMPKEFKEKLAEWEQNNPPSIGKKKPKDPNAPKAAMSAYQFFCADKRQSCKDKGTKQPTMKELGAAWKKVNEKKKSKYEKMAKKDKVRYQEEKEDYKMSEEFSQQLKQWEAANPNKVKKVSKGKKGKKDPNKPKKYKTAWQFFYSEMNNELKEKDDLSSEERRTEISRLWKEDIVTDKDRKKWINLSKKDRARYAKEMEDYDESESDKKSSETENSENESENDTESENEKVQVPTKKKVRKRKPTKKVAKKPAKKVTKKPAKKVARKSMDEFEAELDSVDSDFENEKDNSSSDSESD